MPHPVSLQAIEFDTRTQTRAVIDDAAVSAYAEAMAGGREFPPVTLFLDGPTRRHFIGDGWHRLLAARRLNVPSFPANVENGGLPAAVKHALGANATHGLPRTNADKRKAVELALRTYPTVSDREIAKLCAVAHSFVANVRPGQVDSESTRQNLPTTRTGGDGKTYPATQPARSTPPPTPTAAPVPAATPRPAPVVAVAVVNTPKPTPAPEIARVVWSKPKAVATVREILETLIAEAPEEHRPGFEAAILGVVQELCAPPEPKAGASTTYGDRKTIPPLPEWVTAYSQEIGYPLDGAKWCDSYAVKGWKVGNSRMKDWQAAVRNWKTNGYGQGTVAIKGTAPAKVRAEDYKL